MRVPRLSVTFLLAVCAAGCYRWKPELSSVDRAVNEHPGRIRVASDGGVVELREPRVVGDSLIGFVHAGNPETRRAIAMAELQVIYVRRLDRGATFGAAALAGAGAAVVYTIVKATTGETCSYCSVSP